MAGLAQKGGAVYSHIEIGPSRSDIHAIRVAAGEADMVLGCDIVVAGTQENARRRAPDESGVFVKRQRSFPGDFTPIGGFFAADAERHQTGDARPAADEPLRRRRQESPTGSVGDAIAANMLMVGYAWQRAGCRVSRASILQAIVSMSKRWR